MRLSLYSTDVPAAARYTAAARALEPGDDSAVLAYHPVARMNPFQDLLYAEAGRHNVSVVGAPKITDLLDLAAVPPLGAKAIAHLHWTSGIASSAYTRQEAEDAVDEFHYVLDELAAGGIRLIWTIHNRLPHGCPWPQTEIRLRNGLVDRADAIHLMNPQTIELTSDLFRLPEEKTFLAPHPSYLGAYSRVFDRTKTRLELGLIPSHFVAGLVGSIQPYKGIEELLRAAPSIRRRTPRFDVVVAGIPGRDPESLALVEELNKSEAVVSLPAQLSDRSLARIVTSMDILVLPYRTTLNSGAAMLGLSFGVPVLGPAVGPFVPLIEAGFALGYPPDEPHGLLQALEAAPEFVAGVDRAAVADYVHGVRAEIASSEFFRGLWSKVGGT